jgi:hypothetical protein
MRQVEQFALHPAWETSPRPIRVIPAAIHAQALALFERSSRDLKGDKRDQYGLFYTVSRKLS